MELKPIYASLIATMAFGFIFNVPKKALISGGFIGMIGWTSFIFLASYQLETISSTLLAAFIVATLSQLLAKYHKMPVTVFSVAGIIPLVPGGLAYETMRFFVENNYSMAIKYATKTLLISGAIAFGLILSGVISQIIKKDEKKNAIKDKIIN